MSPIYQHLAAFEQCHIQTGKKQQDTGEYPETGIMLLPVMLQKIQNKNSLFE